MAIIELQVHRRARIGVYVGRRQGSSMGERECEAVVVASQAERGWALRERQPVRMPDCAGALAGRSTLCGVEHEHRGRDGDHRGAVKVGLFEE